MNNDLFLSAVPPGAWGTPWCAARFLPVVWLAPGSKKRRRRPSLVLGGILPVSLLGLSFLVPPAFAHTGHPGLPGLFQNVDAAELAAIAAHSEVQAVKATANSNLLDVNPLAIPVQRPRATAAPRSGSNTGVASALPRGRGEDAEPGRRNQATLVISTDAFSDAAIRGLLDAWLIPMIVGDIIKGQAERRHDADLSD